MNNSVLPITFYQSEVCALTLYYYIWSLGEYVFYYIISQYSKTWQTAKRNLLLPKMEKFWKFYEKKTLSFRFTRCFAAHEKSHCIYFLDNGKLWAHCTGFWEAWCFMCYPPVANVKARRNQFLHSSVAYLPSLSYFYFPLIQFSTIFSNPFPLYFCKIFKYYYWSAWNINKFMIKT